MTADIEIEATPRDAEKEGPVTIEELLVSPEDTPALNTVEVLTPSQNQATLDLLVLFGDEDPQVRDVRDSLITRLGSAIQEKESVLYYGLAHTATEAEHEVRANRVAATAKDMDQLRKIEGSLDSYTITDPELLADIKRQSHRVAEEIRLNEEKYRTGFGRWVDKVKSGSWRLLLYGGVSNLIAFGSPLVIEPLLGLNEVALAHGAVEAITFAIPLVPGTAGLFRLIGFGLVEGAIQGNKNYVEATANGEERSRAKEIGRSIVIGLPAALDFCWALTPMLAELRKRNIRVHPRQLREANKIWKLCKKYKVPVPHIVQEVEEPST